jgi:hypothetical protein
MKGARLYAIVVFPTEFPHKVVSKIGKSIGLNGLANIPHQSLEKGEVMQGT